MPQYPHERACTRLPLRLQVEVIAGDISIHCEETRDISLKGVYMTTGQRLPLGVECDVAIDPGGPDPGRRVELKGHVVRVDVSGIAVEFTEIGVDAFYQLRNLLEISTPGPDSSAKDVTTASGDRFQA